VTNLSTGAIELDDEDLVDDDEGFRPDDKIQIPTVGAN
jgi:hypothetical protein